MKRYSVVTSASSSGVTVSLNTALPGGGTSGAGELLRHFPASKGEAAWRAYERRLRAVADILNPPAAAAALEEAESALDIAQAAVESSRDRRRLLTALEVVRMALSEM